MENTKRIKIERPPEIPVRVEVGNLTLIASGVVSFPIEEPVCIHIGKLTVDFIFKNNATGRAEFERRAVPENLTYQYIVTGKIPLSPLSLGIRFPENIGIAVGHPIWLTFGFSALGIDGRSVSLQYTVYQGEKEIPLAVKGTEANNA